VHHFEKLGYFIFNVLSAFWDSRKAVFWKDPAALEGVGIKSISATNLYYRSGLSILMVVVNHLKDITAFGALELFRGIGIYFVCI